MAKVAHVLVPPLPEPYTYLIRESDYDAFDVGYEIVMSFNRRMAVGYISDIQEFDTNQINELKFKLKELIPLKINHLAFLPEQISFFKWVANFYQVSLSEIIDLAIPKFSQGRVEVKIKLEKNIDNLTTKQSSVIEHLKKNSLQTQAELNRLFGSSVIKTLIKKGCLLAIYEEQKKEEFPIEKISLNEEQQKALEKILNNENRPVLIHGETGSGKTEVYIELARKYLELGKSCLILVPEISLTPQLIDRIQARLEFKVASLHSGMKASQRWKEWQSILDNNVQVVIGARSALFAPLKNIGLIVIDEEHDSSFKQNEGIRYNARDLAIVLAQQHQAKIVLGSATPSLETYYNSVTGKYLHIPLEKHFKSENKLDFQIVDLSKKNSFDLTTPHVSNELYTEIKKCLDEKQQIFLLYNRRGFSTYLQCENCSEVLTCPNCSVTLTYHKNNNKVLCHYCDYQIQKPGCCNNCIEKKANKYLLKGGGTEQVYDEILSIFPNARTIRLDRDVANNIETYKEIIGKVRNREIDILIGTQMMAKGHDLPGVKLVGIIDCDIGLNMPDFRSSEKTFQLLTQAAGRAGRRGQGGKIILQTRVAEHMVMKATKREDYKNFANYELKLRQLSSYPPFIKLLRVVISSTDEALAENTIRNYKKILESAEKELPFSILGPAKAPINKINNYFRWNLLIKSEKHKTLVTLVNLLKSYKINKKIRVIYDIDPTDLL